MPTDICAPFPGPRSRSDRLSSHPYTSQGSPCQVCTYKYMAVLVNHVRAAILPETVSSYAPGVPVARGCILVNVHIMPNSPSLSNHHQFPCCPTRARATMGERQKYVPPSRHVPRSTVMRPSDFPIWNEYANTWSRIFHATHAKRRQGQGTSCQRNRQTASKMGRWDLWKRGWVRGAFSGA